MFGAAEQDGGVAQAGQEEDWAAPDAQGHQVGQHHSSSPANPKPSSNRIVQLTAAAEGKIKREGTKQPRQMHDPLFPINCWTDEEVKMISGDHFLFCCFVFL